MTVNIYSLEPKLEGTVWELIDIKLKDSEFEDINRNNSKESLGDLNGDGIDETVEFKMFMTLNNSVMRIYMKMDYSGSKEYFELMGLKPTFTYIDSTYEISGQTIMSDNERISFKINDDKLFFTDKENNLTIFKPNSSIDLTRAKLESEELY